MAGGGSASRKPSDEASLIRAELKAELEGVKSQLKLMTLVFAGCVAVATAIAGYIFTQIVSFAGPISRIPIIEETLKNLEGKTNELAINVAQIKTQLGYVSNDLASIKVAVKAADITPPPISGKKQINQNAFPGWLGVPISNVKSASEISSKIPTSKRNGVDFLNKHGFSQVPVGCSACTF